MGSPAEIVYAQSAPGVIDGRLIRDLDEVALQLFD